MKVFDKDTYLDPFWIDSSIEIVPYFCGEFRLIVGLLQNLGVRSMYFSKGTVIGLTADSCSCSLRKKIMDPALKVVVAPGRVCNKEQDEAQSYDAWSCCKEGSFHDRYSTDIPLAVVQGVAWQ